MREFYEAREKLSEILSELSDEVLLEMWNDFCNKNKYGEDYIHDMSDIDDWFMDCTPTEIIEATKNVDTTDSYFKDGIYGLESFDMVGDAVDFDDLAEHLLENELDYGVEEIVNFFEEENENEDVDISDKIVDLKVSVNDMRLMKMALYSMAEKETTADAIAEKMRSLALYLNRLEQYEQEEANEQERV